MRADVAQMQNLIEKYEVSVVESDKEIAAALRLALNSLYMTIETLEFYADPETYHAIAFFPDLPCGEFMDDFSADHGNDFYDRPMPGKRARSALGVGE